MIPQRMCIVCRTRREKQELLRIAKQPDGQIIVDAIGKCPGRGAYVCRDKDCIEKAVKRKQLNRAFKGTVDDDVYSFLSEINEEL